MKVSVELLFKKQKALPIFFSGEAGECGLACLAMVASFHGHDIDLNTLRQRFAISLSGANLRNIIEIADALDLSTRALRLEVEDLVNLEKPAILHWDFNHFVVLKGINGQNAVIHDPARGILTYSLPELSKHFTGVALETFPGDLFRKITDRARISIASLWSRFHGLANGAALAVFLSVVLQLLTFILPFQMQLVVDEAIGRNDADLLTVIAMGFGGLIVLQIGISAMRDWTLQLFGSQMMYQMVGNLLRHLIRLPSSFFEKRHVGDILSRLGSTNAIKDALTQGILAGLIDGAMALVSGIILFIYSPILAFVVIGSLLLIAAANLAFYPFIRASTEEQINTSANEQSHLMESVRAVRTVKLFGRESAREGAWRNLYSKTFNASLSVAKFQLWLNCLQGLFTGIQTVLIIYLGARNILNAQGFSVGMLMAFLSFRQTFTDRAQSLVTKVFQFRMLSLHMDRLSDIIVQEPEISDDGHVPTEIGERIELTQVSFRYGVSDPWIFEALSLDIAPGEFVAITGPSGGGKSTLLKLMLGLQKPDRGQITLGGAQTDINIWKSWRSKVGVVVQDDQLLSGTLSDNIAFFDTDLNMERVHQAAKAAQIHDDIQRMPMKYLTLVGDMGSTLSGGQKQRVLLARALYREPKILVLDEGTANLDPATEDAIAELIAKMPITRVVVAHRPALVDRATRILRVEHGHVLQISREQFQNPTKIASILEVHAR